MFVSCALPMAGPQWLSELTSEYFWLLNICAHLLVICANGQQVRAPGHPSREACTG